MAYGKPIITSHTATTKECMANYEGALLASVGDSAAIAERLAEVYNRHKPGETMIFDPLQSTWHTVARH